MADGIIFTPDEDTPVSESSVVQDQSSGPQSDGSPTADDTGAFTGDTPYGDLKGAIADFLGFDPTGTPLLPTSLTGFADDTNAAEEINALTIAPGDSGEIQNVSVSLTTVGGSYLDAGSTVLDSDWNTVSGDDVGLVLHTYMGETYVIGVVLNGDDSVNRVAFAAKIDPTDDGTNWSVDLQLVTFEALDHPDPSKDNEDIDLSGRVQIDVAQSTVFGFANTPSGKNLFTQILSANGESLLIVTPDVETLELNTSKGGGEITLGYANQMIDEGETLIFTFATPIDESVNGFDNYVPNLDQNEADLETNIEFDALKLVDGGEVFIVQEQGNEPTSLTLEAVSSGTEDGNDFISNIVASTSDMTKTVDIVDLIVKDTATATGSVLASLGDAIETSMGSGVFVDGAYTFTDNGDGTWTVLGITSGTSIVYSTGTNLHSSLLVTGESGKFDIGGIGINEPSAASYDIGRHLVVRDDAPEAGFSGTVVIDDDDFGSNGNAGGTEDNATSASLTGVLNADTGNDGGDTTWDASGHVVDVILTGITYVVTDSGKTLTVKQDGSDVFKVDISGNATDGFDYTVEQLGVLKHTDGSDENNAVFTLNYTVKDGDDDTDAGSLKVNVDDDTPKITDGAGDPMLTTDDDDIPDTATEVSFASLFNISHGADGAKATGGMAYKLIATEGANSGLDATVAGDDVLLSINAAGTEVIGYLASGSPGTTSDRVFKITLDPATGSITMTQYLAVAQGDPTADNESVSMTGLNTIQLEATATDTDNDTATATKDITARFKFLDDNPTAGPSGTVVIDDDDETGGIAGGTEDNATSASLTGVLNADTGNDGGDTTWDASGHVVDVILTGITYVVTDSGKTLTVKQDGSDVFKVDISGNATDGFDYTVEQLGVLKHTDGSDENNAVFTLNYTVKDGDDDTAAGSLKVDVDDDTPKVTEVGTAPSLQTDDSDVDDAGGSTTGAKSFTGLFNLAYGADGKATSDEEDYALSVTAGPTGLFDVATDASILLKLNAGGTMVTGYYDDPSDGTDITVFTLTLDGTNKTLTLTQVRAVRHETADGGTEGSTAPAFDEAIGLTGSDLIKLTATIKDMDGDTAFKTVDITDKLSFKDDGPSSGLTGTVIIDDDDVTGAMGNSDGDGDDVPSASLTGVLNADNGNDGGDTTWDASGHGVDVTLSGITYDVSSEGKTLTVKQGGLAVFTVVISGDAASGFDYTVTQNGVLAHGDPGDANTENNAIFTLNYTVKDGDNDTASGSLKVDVDDDTPKIGTGPGTPTLTTDDTDITDTAGPTSFASLFEIDYGADDAKSGGGDVYKLLASSGTDSGLDDTLTGQNVLLSINAMGTEIIGYLASGSAGTPTDQVFKITLNPSNGDIALEQFRSVEHTNTMSNNESTTMTGTDKIKLQVTATDGDDDDVMMSVDITDKFKFLDDGPKFDVNNQSISLTTDDSDLSPDSASGVTFADLFTPNFGKDGAKDDDNNGADDDAVVYHLSVSADAQDSGLDDAITGKNVLLKVNDLNTIVTGYIVADDGTSHIDVFTLTIVEKTGAATLTQIRAIKHPNAATDNEELQLGDNVYVKVTATATDGDGDTATDTKDVGLTLNFKDAAPLIGDGSGNITSQTGDDALTFADGSSTGQISLDGDPNKDGTGPGDTVKEYTLVDYTGDGDDAGPAGVNGDAVVVGGETLETKLIGPDATSGISTLYYYNDVDGVAGYDDTGAAGDVLYFTLEIGPDGPAAGVTTEGYYDFEVHYTPPPAFELFDFDDLPAGQNLFGMVGDSSNAIMLLGADPLLKNGELTNGSQTVNSSKGSEWSDSVIANTNNSFDRPDEGLWIVYVTDPNEQYLAGAPDGLDQNEADVAANMLAGDFREAAKAFFQVAQTVGNSTAEVSIAAFDLDATNYMSGSEVGGEDLVNALDVDSADPGGMVNISRIVVYAAEDLRLPSTSYETLTPIYDSAVDSGLENGIEVTITDGVAEVTGLDSGMIVEWTTVGDHDAALVTRLDGKYDVGFIGVAEENPTEGEIFDFSVQIEDFDGDTDVASFSIDVSSTDDEGMV